MLKIVFLAASALLLLSSCDDPACEKGQPFTFSTDSKTYDLSEYVSSVDCADGFIIVRLNNEGSIETLHITRRHEGETVYLTYGESTQGTIFAGGGTAITEFRINR